MQRNCSSAESSSANDARKTPSKHARRRTTEGETTSTTQDDAQHHREHDTIPSHNTIMPAKTQPTTDICGFSRKQDAIIINPDERSSARWARDCAYPAHYVDYETYPEDVGVPEGRLSEEKQLPANIVKLGPHSVEGPKRPCPHCEASEPPITTRPEWPQRARARALLNVVGAGPLARPPRSSPTPARVCLRVLRAAGRIAGEWIPFSGAMARHSAYIRSCQCPITSVPQSTATASTTHPW